MKNKLYIPQNKYEKTALQLPIKKSINKTDPSVKKSNPVIIDFKKSISDLPTDIYKSAVIFLNKITEIDKNQEITLISNYLIRSFIKQPSKKNIDLSYKFGEANLYAWIAYTIYDDFVDDEGLPELLPLANIFHRRSFIIYLRHYQSKKPLIVSHYDSVDTSNLWELQKCRAKVKGGKIFLRNIPDYKNGTFLAKRAIGHVLGPKILIENYNLSLHQKKLIFEALDKYLIAKQINDDIEDWKIDLHNGHISYVVAKLLNSSGKRIGEYDIENLIIELQHEFWETVLEECLLFALNELKKAENCLKKSNSFKSKNLFIDNIIQPLEITIQTSMKNHQNDKLFFKSYTI